MRYGSSSWRCSGLISVDSSSTLNSTTSVLNVLSSNSLSKFSLQTPSVAQTCPNALSQQRTHVLSSASPVLTLSLPKPVKFLGRKVHTYTRTCVQTVYFPVLCQTNLFLILCVVTDILSAAKVREKRLKDFKLCMMIGCFQMTPWQWKG